MLWAQTRTRARPARTLASEVSLQRPTLAATKRSQLRLRSHTAGTDKRARETKHKKEQERERREGGRE